RDEGGGVTDDGGEEVMVAGLYRDRERNVSRYNEFRRSILLIPISKLEDLTGNQEAIETLRKMYGDDENRVHPPQPDWYKEFYARVMDKTVITYEAELSGKPGWAIAPNPQMGPWSGVKELSALMTILSLHSAIVSSCLKSGLLIELQAGDLSLKILHLCCIFVGQEEVLFQFEPSKDGEVQFHPSGPIVVEKSPSVGAINEVLKLVKGVWLLEIEKLEIVSTN
nr:alpha-dioxygenase 1-like [Tanacetum cinerariifolium]